MLPGRPSGEMMMNRWIPQAICLLVTISSQLLLAQPNEKPADQPNPVLHDVRGVVKAFEDRLAAEEQLLRKKISTEGSVDALRVEVAKARHDLALAEDQPRVIKEQRRVLLEIRHRQLERLEKARRPPAEISIARRRLATAKYLIAQMEGEHEVVLEQLHLIIHLSQQEFDLLQKLGPKVVSGFEVHAAENRLACAQYLLAMKENKTDDIIPRLRSLAEMLENEWQKMEKLYRQKSASFFDEYRSYVRKMNAKLRLANSEMKQEVVLELLDQLIEKHEATLKVVDVKEKDRRLLDGIKFELTRDRHRRKSVLNGGPLDVLAVPELD